MRFLTDERLTRCRPVPWMMLWMSSWLVGSLTLPLMVHGQDTADWLRDADRIVFLGDSNTYAGYYISWLDAQLRACLSDAPELINLGLPSETCTGLSEPDHPFPRPNVHERLQRALQRTKPDVVFVAYGMNDGIYHPLDAQRFAAYQHGIDQLIDQIHAAGAKVVLLSPPAFDPLPMRREGKLRSQGPFAWFAAYENYDDVMSRYAQWINEQRPRVEQVVDIHTPLQQYLRDRRAADPNYAMSSDGVHFDHDGHTIVAREILAAAKVEPCTELPEAIIKLVDQRQSLMRDAWLDNVGHTRPGMSKSLPLAEARSQAERLDELIAKRIAATK